MFIKTIPVTNLFICTEKFHRTKHTQKTRMQENYGWDEITDN